MTSNLELYFDTPAAGVQRITIDPIDPQIGDVFTLELDPLGTGAVTVSFTATAATDNNVVTGLKAAIEASADEEWADVTATIVNNSGVATSSGDRLRLQYTTSTGTTRLWRGDAPAVAQVTEVTPSSVSAGDAFTLTVNGKTLTYTATESTVANVVAGLLALIEASDVPEFADFDAVVSGSKLVLTASTPGRPFTVTAGTSSGSGVLTLTKTVTGVTGVQKVQEFYIGKETTTFYLRYKGAQSSVVTVASDNGAAVAGKVDTMLGTSSAACTKTTDSTWTKYVISFDSDGTNDALEVHLQSRVITISEQTTGSAPSTSEVQRIGVATSGTFTITVDGNTTEEIEYGNNSAETATNIQTALRALPQFLNHGGVLTVAAFAASGGLMTFDITFPPAYGNIDAITAAYVTQPSPETNVDQGTLTTTGSLTANTKYSVSVDADAGTFTLTVDGQTTSGIAYNAATSAVKSALEALSSVDTVNVTGSASNYTVEFTGSSAGSDVTLTGSGTGLTGSGSQGLSVSTTTNSSGPNHWDTAANWSPAGVPVTGDAVRIEFGTSEILYGLDQSSVLLTSLEIAQPFSGVIGLPRINDNGFFEYRQRLLAIGATSIVIGSGDGFGSGRIYLDTGANRTDIEVRNSGSSTESGVSAVQLVCDNSLNTVTVYSGEFGTGPHADQYSTLGTVTQIGGTVTLSNCTVTTVKATNQSLRGRKATITGTLEL